MLFRPKQGLCFEKGIHIDGFLFSFATRGDVRTSLAPGYHISPVSG